MSKIKETLEHLFKEHRVIFWYNNDNEFDEDFSNLEIENVRKEIIDNNEFSLKYIISRKQPKQKFLIYSNKLKSDDNNNWLLDLNLAFYEFSADRASMFTQELALPIEKKGFIENYLNFFNSKNRINKLKEKLSKDDNEEQIALKMLSVVVESDESELEYILFKLFYEETKNNENEKYQSLNKLGMKELLWLMISKKYNYNSDNPTITDFLIELFENKFLSSISDPKYTLNREAQLFVSHWMENAKYHLTFETLSEKISNLTKFRDDKLRKYNYKELQKCDVFRDIERKVIFDLVSGLKNRIISYQEVIEVVENRRNKYWYKYFENIYLTLHYTSELINLIQNGNFEINSMKDGYDKYIKSFYKVDHTYRKCVFHYNNSEDTKILKDLSDIFENFYTNGFLIKINDNWQKYVDNCNDWKIENVISQRNFYSNFVEKFVKKGTKITVIICDALRYESAVELNELLLKENKYEANITSMLSSLPSYTQLGIASLLPNKKLSYNSPNDTVYVDDMSSSSQNRAKILQSYIPRSTYISSEEFLNKKMDEGREFSKEYDVIYIYENIIDATGDNAKKESQVFDATKTEFDRVKNIIKTAINFNRSNIIITSDHGYIYQNTALDESDFCSIEKAGEIYKYNRRFIIGKNLYEQDSVKKFTAKELNLDDKTEFLIPKSINRLRVQGGGNRFVHGGATLQEIVIPVIEFNKKRESGETRNVDIDLINPPNEIRSYVQPIIFSQKEPIIDKVLPITLKAGFYSEDGKLLSDEIKLIFDSKDEDARIREKTHTFNFKKELINYDNKTIILILEKPLENKFINYKKYLVEVHISFADEFDDF